MSLGSTKEMLRINIKGNKPNYSGYSIQAKYIGLI
jgi:hypothetical protein